MKNFILAAFFAAFALPACSGNQQFTEGCQVDADCPLGNACRISGGEFGTCICRSDEACGDNEVCNSQGICQQRTGCRSNTECEDDKFCDLATGGCIERTDCGSHVHCIPGTVCPAGGGQCVSGCYESADCPLYQTCQRVPGQALGNCLAGVCEDKSFCAFGENCINGMCQPNSNPNHCADCDPQQPNQCGGPNNYCLINSSYDPNRPENGGPNFCGVECDPAVGDEACPNGYSCNGVILLTQDQCTNDAECGGGGRRCAIGEGQLRGACTCVADQDCAVDQIPGRCRLINRCETPSDRPCGDDSDCDPTDLCQNLGGMQVCATDFSPCNSNQDCLCNNGSCFRTGRPCQTGAECSLTCVGGGCLLGASCGPDEGLLCPDLR